MIVHGDCVAEMAKMPEASVDAVVCDPPYGLEFMNKEWDRLGGPHWGRNDRRWSERPKGGSDPFDNHRPRFGVSPSQMQHWHEAWAREALRVLKPGGHLLAFGGTRTYHRLACAIEDAGFEIRDCLSWMYGSGFPKSLDVSRALDKAAGAEREIVGKSARHVSGKPEQRTEGLTGSSTFAESVGMGAYVTAPATPEAQQWQGWGTALKPAHEPIVMARKPLVGTVAGNVLEHGTGALNVDGCRIGTEKMGGYEQVPSTSMVQPSSQRASGYRPQWDREDSGFHANEATGRWPANVVLSHHEDCQDLPDEASLGIWDCDPSCPVRLLDEQSGNLPTQKNRTGPGVSIGGGVLDWKGSPRTSAFNGESGGASRFFYTAKSSSAERSAGLGGVVEGAERNSHPLADCQAHSPDALARTACHAAGRYGTRPVHGQRNDRYRRSPRRLQFRRHRERGGVRAYR
jgi:hypothetical protein